MSDKLEILHTRKLPGAEKHPKKTFLSGASNIEKIESEIFKYLPNISLTKSSKIFKINFLSAPFNSSPYSSNTTCMQPARIATDSCVNLPAQ